MFCEQAHEFGHPDFDNHNSTGMFGYSLQGWLTYGKTKLSNLYFTYELHRRMRLAGIDDVDVNAVHPVSLFLVIFWHFLVIFWQWSVWAISCKLTACFVHRASLTPSCLGRFRSTSTRCFDRRAV